MHNTHTHQRVRHYVRWWKKLQCMIFPNSNVSIQQSVRSGICMVPKQVIKKLGYTVLHNCPLTISSQGNDTHSSFMYFSNLNKIIDGGGGEEKNLRFLDNKYFEKSLIHLLEWLINWWCHMLILFSLQRHIFFLFTNGNITFMSSIAKGQSRAITAAVACCTY